MTLLKKLQALTPGQWGKFHALKDGAGLDAFLSETGVELTAEEKAQALEYIESGKLPLDDEKLDNVAGGSGMTVTCTKCWSKDTDFDWGPGYYNFLCKKCGYKENHVTPCMMCGSTDLDWRYSDYLCKKCGFRSMDLVPEIP